MAIQLSIGDNAPQFSTVNQHNTPIQLADYSDKTLVVYFYPKDDTPGCTIEANDFTQLASEFKQANAVVLGVSKDSCQSHQDFIQKFELQIDLLADTSGQMCQDFGVWQEKTKNGETKMGIVRSTFIIKNNLIVDAEYGVDPNGHAQAVLEKVKAL